MDLELIDVFECCEVMKHNKEYCIFYKGKTTNDLVMHDMRTGNGLNLIPVNYCHACGKRVKKWSDFG